MVGVPFYAWTFTLANPSVSGDGAPIDKSNGVQALTYKQVRLFATMELRRTQKYAKFSQVAGKFDVFRAPKLCTKKWCILNKDLSFHDCFLGLGSRKSMGSNFGVRLRGYVLYTGASNKKLQGGEANQQKPSMLWLTPLRKSCQQVGCGGCAQENLSSFLHAGVYETELRHDRGSCGRRGCQLLRGWFQMGGVRRPLQHQEEGGNCAVFMWLTRVEQNV